MWLQTGKLLGIETPSVSRPQVNIDPPTVSITPSQGGGPSITLHNNPTIYIDGNRPGDLEEKLQQNNESLLQMFADYLRQRQDDERRMGYA